MKVLDNSVYSLFQNIDDISSIADKKKFKDIINNFMICTCEIYNIKIEQYSLPEENMEIYDFLIQLGVIKNVNQIDLLKKLLENEYDKLIYVVSEYLKLGIKNDNINIMKFMDNYRKEAVKKYFDDTESPTVVDFFCGAGGMSLGFSQNGYKILLSNDIENVCTTTYSFNHYEIPKDRIITGDIREIVNNVDTYIEDDVDVIIGGPPCQGFSMANRQRIIDDPRNVLYKYYVEGVRRLKPKFFVMENVKGMLGVADQVVEDFHSLNDVDYEVSYKLFNAKDFSVPQNRERLIYIGIRSDIKEKTGISAEGIIEEIIQYTKGLPKYVLDDAIGDLRKLEPFRIKNAAEKDTEESGKKIEKNNSNIVNDYISAINNGKVNELTYNHKARYNNDRDIEIFGRMLPGDKSDSERIADIMPYQTRKDIFKDKYYKLKPDEICKTITAHMKFDCNMYIHPGQARGLTPREAARVQSYPDDYFFLGSYTKTYMQVGNSVPPLMSRVIAEVIKKYILKSI